MTFVSAGLPRERHPSMALVADAEGFGSVRSFGEFARALSEVQRRLPFRRLIAVSSLFWATDESLAEWSELGWLQIVVHRRPEALTSLRIIRGLEREGGVMLLAGRNETTSLVTQFLRTTR